MCRLRSAVRVGELWKENVMKGKLLGGRARAATLAAVAVLAAALIGGGVSSADPSAHAARATHHLSGTAYFHLVRKSGNTLYERGTATGSLSGRVSGTFHTSVTKVTGTVTFYPHGGGSLTMTAVGYPQSAGTIARFSGNLAVRGGTGRFARATGSGSFTGTANRRTWAITVSAHATLRY
jgi:hypothetical protein